MAVLGLGWLALAGAVALGGCSTPRNAPRADYVPLAELEATYGQLITAGNHPTRDQNGTGDRIGIFRDSTGTIWGLPLNVASGGAVLGCAPAGLRDAKVTDTYPADATILGATNAPTGWRGGTGQLELLMRGPRGDTQWRAVTGGQVASGPVCWAQESPGPPMALEYYRLAPVAQ